MSTVIRTTLSRISGDIQIEVNEIDASQAIAAFTEAVRALANSDD